MFSSSRPASAGTDPSRHPAFAVDDELMTKIRLLAEHHARNIQALHRLRQLARGKKRQISMRAGVSRDDSFLRRSSPARLNGCTFTRVTTSTGSSWKNVPTVAEPFRRMDTSATAWVRQRRKYDELKFQMRMEEEEARAQDRARFVAAINDGKAFSRVIARSEEMMERRRQRAEEAKQREEKLQRNHEFKARPLHMADDDWQTIQDRQTMRRNQRIKMRKEMMMSVSRLPKRMAMHALKKKAAAEAATTFNNEEAQTTSFKSSVPPDKIRELLARRQLLWDQHVKAAKRKKKPVVPQVLPMEERERHYRLRAQERAQREKERAVLVEQTHKEELKRRRERTAASTPIPVLPRTTYKCMVRAAQVQAKLKKERDDLKRENDRKMARQSRQQTTSKALAELMRRIDRQQGRLSPHQTQKGFQKKARESEARYHQALKENRSKLEQATRDAPTLWERHDAELRREEAKRIAVSTIADRVFGSKANWRGSAVEKIFDEEEKVCLLGLEN